MTPQMREHLRTKFPRAHRAGRTARLVPGVLRQAVITFFILYAAWFFLVGAIGK